MIKMIESDKNREVRRGASRFSRQAKQSGHKLFNGLNGSGGGCDVVSSKKPKKERRKRLIGVSTASSSFDENCEMGHEGSDHEEEIPSQPPSSSRVGRNKRLKLPRKQFLDECNGVDHSSVPRKLRSAKKKRSRASISPPFPGSKKLNQTNGRVEKDGVKKSKVDMSVCGPITKDEEEVVETLYALAGMFLDNGPSIRSEQDDSLLHELPSAMPEEASENIPTLEDCKLRGDESGDPGPGGEKILEEVGNKESIIQELPNQPDFEALSTELDHLVDRANHDEGNLVCCSADFSIPHLPNDDTQAIKQPADLEIPLSVSNPEIALELTTEKQPDQQHKIEDSDRKGPVLWSGLSSTVSSGPWNHGPPSQSSVAKIPSWLDAAVCSQNFSSPRKVQVKTDRILRKRCATHVDISRFIKFLQTSEIKDNLALHSHQLGQQGILNQGGVMPINDLNAMRNASRGVTSAGGAAEITENNPVEARTGILQSLGLYQDQPQASQPSGSYTSQQSFDFLSLSPGRTTAEANNTFSRATKGLEPSTQLQYPYMHGQVQHPPNLPPFSMSHHSTTYPDQPSAAAVKQAQIQLPTYLGNPFYGPHASTVPLAKQQLQHHHQLQHRKQLWATQYRNVGTSVAMTQFPRELPTTIQRPQFIIPPAPSPPVEVFSSKYHHISQQQHEYLMTFPSSLPHARMKKQDHRLPSVYEESGGGFRSGGLLPLQLL